MPDRHGSPELEGEEGGSVHVREPLADDVPGDLCGQVHQVASVAGEIVNGEIAKNDARHRVAVQDHVFHRGLPLFV